MTTPPWPLPVGQPIKRQGSSSSHNNTTKQKTENTILKQNNTKKKKEMKPSCRRVTGELEINKFAKEKRRKRQPRSLKPIDRSRLPPPHFSRLPHLLHWAAWAGPDSKRNNPSESMPSFTHGIRLCDTGGDQVTR